MRRTLLLTTLVALVLPTLAHAQDPRDLAVKTFTLRNLKPDDAAKLLGPYVTAPGGGVFEAGSIGAITVRETFTNLTLIDSLLRIHDRPRAAVTMRFQLIAALDSARRDPAIDGIDAELRKLFRFPGYELIGEGTTRTEEMSDFIMTLSTKAKFDGRERTTEAFQIRGWIEGVEGAGDAATLRVTIVLQGALGNDAELLRTGLTMPAGQSVILGSARPTMTYGNRVAIILVVQPTVSAGARR